MVERVFPDGFAVTAQRPEHWVQRHQRRQPKRSPGRGTEAHRSLQQQVRAGPFADSAGDLPDGGDLGLPDTARCDRHRHGCAVEEFVDHRTQREAADQSAAGPADHERVGLKSNDLVDEPLRERIREQPVPSGHHAGRHLRDGVGQPLIGLFGDQLVIAGRRPAEGRQLAGEGSGRSPVAHRDCAPTGCPEPGRQRRLASPDNRPPTS